MKKTDWWTPEIKEYIKDKKKRRKRYLQTKRSENYEMYKEKK